MYHADACERYTRWQKLSTIADQKRDTVSLRFFITLPAIVRRPRQRRQAAPSFRLRFPAID